MSRHADAQTLAAFREGLLPARKAARITAHLATCQRCAEVDAQLAAVTTVLAHTPAPPMPASLADRLDAALAAEIARSAAASPAEAASPSASASPAGAASAAGAASPAGAAAPGERDGHRAGTGTGRDTAGGRAGSGRAPRRLSLRLAAVAAAVVILAGGGYAIAHVLSAGQTGTSASSSASAPSLGAPSHSAIARPAVPGLGPEAAPRAGSTLPLVASGTDYRSGQLPTQVGAVLKRHPAPGTSPSRARSASAVPTTAPPVSTTAFPHLSKCVTHFAKRVPPRLVDIAHYGGRPAAVIVVPVLGTANVRVWVVGRGCSAQGGDVIAQFSMPAPG